MSDALFLFDSRLDDVDNTTLTVSTGTEVSSMPIENIQDVDRSLPARITPSSTVAVIDITLPGARVVDTFALVDCNITTGGTYRLRAWSDAIRGSTLVYDSTAVAAPIPTPADYTASNYGSGDYGLGSYGAGTALPDEIDRSVYIVDLEAEYTARYWELTITDANLSFVQLSRVYLSLRKNYDINISYGWQASPERRSDVLESIGGARYRNLKPQRRRLTVEYTALTDSERDEVLMNLQQFGQSIPFIFCAEPFINDNRTASTAIYGVYDGPSASNPTYNSNRFSFTMSEDL